MGGPNPPGFGAGARYMTFKLFVYIWWACQVTDLRYIFVNFCKIPEIFGTFKRRRHPYRRASLHAKCHFSGVLLSFCKVLTNSWVGWVE